MVIAAAPLSTSTHQQQPTLLLNISKKEDVANLKSFQRYLRNNFNKFQLHKDDYSSILKSNCTALIFSNPQEKFTVKEFDDLRKYLAGGGSLLYCAGEQHSMSNFNYLLEEFGMSCNKDAVTRTVYYKYFHPKEVFISNGVLNREITRYICRDDYDASVKSTSEQKGQVKFVYPFGCTLNVQRPSFPVLSSGTASYPLNRPVAAVHLDQKTGGKIIVCGSAKMFQDDYFDKEDNAKIIDFLLRFLSSDQLQLNVIDAEDPDISDYHILPNTALLAENPLSCVQDLDDVPKDFTSLFDSKMLNFDLNLLTDVTRAYKDINVKHEPLTLIDPEFDIPLPAMKLSIYPPAFKEPTHPQLELFDLDDEFSSESTQLAQLTNKCNDDDLEYFLREAGKIIGLPTEVINGGGKRVLATVLRHIVNWKTLNPEPVV